MNLASAVHNMGAAPPAATCFCILHSCLQAVTCTFSVSCMYHVPVDAVFQMTCSTRLHFRAFLRTYKHDYAIANY